MNREKNYVLVVDAKTGMIIKKRVHFLLFGNAFCNMEKSTIVSVRLISTDKAIKMGYEEGAVYETV